MTSYIKNSEHWEKTFYRLLFILQREKLKAGCDQLGLKTKWNMSDDEENQNKSKSTSIKLGMEADWLKCDQRQVWTESDLNWFRSG